MPLSTTLEPPISGGPELIKAERLSHAFDYSLFENIDLTIRENEKVAVIGVSGSGKSTLLHILATLLKPQHGTVELLGSDIYSLTPKQQLAIRRFEIGIIFQFHYLFKGMSAAENIEIATLLSDTEFDDALLKRLGIENVVHQRVTELSGGQQQRVSIARVLSKNPRLIFADEPTGNLDDETAHIVMDAVFEHIEKVSGALFLVTHDERIARSCDRVYRLENQVLEQIQ
ncbi:ABC transporter ATP-binding protein [Hydrogenimonas cancrithermarum]|uniref:ABC transporter ATP-binding protein n=1 Tax=Hydrogenimonas cancrithermarum TaxID=2993563 RepID=A0ABN6WXG3_9BACT|nr:ABC transporter ATP-binding protein [Hydrogenimonas cancrithermarum]BDY12727.1 ABC transporter ATP-binding protein [Hydrogenimonas cancrithermarum]